MPYTPGANSAFYGDGIGHAVNPGRANAGSITMGDPGLDQTATNQAALTPHDVLSTTPAAASSGVTFEGMQRLTGNFNSPGAYGKFSDEMSGGADTYQSGEE